MAVEYTQVRQIAIFFLLSLCEEEVAITASNKAFNHYFNGQKRDRGMTNQVALIKSCQLYLDKFRSQHRKGDLLDLSFEWQLPNSINLRLWQKFVNLASPEIISAAIWCLILNVSIDELAKALGVSEGTIRYRNSVALKKIGELLSSDTNVRMMNI
jgi:DNA-directed RNA polymerase specialized sigma24 family protein